MIFNADEEEAMVACLMLETYPRKASLTLRVEPQLKEQYVNATTAPLTAAELKKFVEDSSKKYGLRIEYGCPSLERDDWLFDALTNKEHMNRLRQ